ncbi:MAG: hypothetical protein QM831_20980 [Kofleriaceae bacterium]
MTYQQCVEALGRGERVRVGAGRYYNTYFMKDGVLYRSVFDEGQTWEEPTNLPYLKEDAEASINADYVYSLGQA